MIQIRTFGEALTLLRTRNDLSQQELAEKSGISRDTIANWELNNKIPAERQIVIELGNVLQLNAHELNVLLRLTQFNPIDKSTDGSIETITVGRYIIMPDSSLQYDHIQELQVQIRDIQDSVISLHEKAATKEASSTPNGNSSLTDEIENLKAHIGTLQTTSQQLTAPIRLPDPDEMEVKLVPIESIQRLEEYRADENKWNSWLGVFVGAIIAIIVNIVTGGQTKTETWILLVVFAFLCMLTGLSAYNYKKRADKLVAHLLKTHEN